MTIWRVLVAQEADTPAEAAARVASRLEPKRRWSRNRAPQAVCVLKVIDDDGKAVWKPRRPSA